MIKRYNLIINYNQFIESERMPKYYYKDFMLQIPEDILMVVGIPRVGSVPAENIQVSQHHISIEANIPDSEYTTYELGATIDFSCASTVIRDDICYISGTAYLSGIYIAKMCIKYTKKPKVDFITINCVSNHL